jgi:hypothetical protein
MRAKMKTFFDRHGKTLRNASLGVMIGVPFLLYFAAVGDVCGWSTSSSA